MWYYLTSRFVLLAKSLRPPHLLDPTLSELLSTKVKAAKSYHWVMFSANSCDHISNFTFNKEHYINITGYCYHVISFGRAESDYIK